MVWVFNPPSDPPPLTSTKSPSLSYFFEAFPYLPTIMISNKSLHGSGSVESIRYTQPDKSGDSCFTLHIYIGNSTKMFINIFYENFAFL